MAIQNILPDLTHIARTTYQWEHTADKYEIIPNGVLCIEFVKVDQTLIKIGDGHHIYKQLPYVSSIDLKNYYTKEETDNRIIEIFNELKSIRIKGEVSDLSHLPTDNNTEGDLWFVRRTSPSGHSRYDEYVWYKNNWESIGLSESDIDLSEYAKKEYVDEKIEEVDEKIDRYMHTHSNKEILDQITAPFTTEKDEKLESLHNYDDTEIRRIIDERTHTHSNKSILDQTSAAYTTDKDNKLASLENYDDTAVQDRLTLLERIAHFHENQEILNRTTAAFTREQAITLLDCKDFEGTDGTNDGYHGFVPAPTAADAGKVLGANGQWVPMSGGGGGDTVAEGGGISITTDAQTGNKVIAVNAGTGLSIDPVTGELNVTGGGGGGDTVTEGGGISITTDPQTGNKVISVDVGDNLEIDQVTGELNVSGVMEEFNIGKGLELVLPTIDTLPTGYGHVDYVQTSGAAYAELDYYVTVNTKVVGTATCDTFNNDAAVFGTRQGMANNEFVMWMQQQSSDPTNMITGFVYGNNSWGTSTDAKNGRTAPYHQGDQYDFEASVAGGLKINNQLLHNVTNYGNPSYTKLHVFACNGYNGGIYNGKLYQFKLYENDTLSAKLIPAVRLSDNVVGFYDVVNDDFYTSNTSTPFTTDMSTLIIDDPTKVLNAKIGDGLQFDSNNAIEVNTGDGLSVNQDNELEVNLGNGLLIDGDGQIAFDESILPDDPPVYAPGVAISFVDNQNPYVTKVRWTISEIRGGVTDPWIQLRYFGFYDSNQNRIPILSGIGAWEDGSVVSYYQHRTLNNMVANAYEMTASTWTGSNPFIMTFDLPSGTRLKDLKYFRYQTGDDENYRDPVSWTIHVYDEELDRWLLIDTETSATVPTNRNAWTSYFDLAYDSSSSSDIPIYDINVKYGDGLTVNQNNELEVKIGTGLEFDQVTGEINVTTGGDTVTKGDGINITTDSQTGVKTISVDIGDGLQFNQDGEVEIDPSIIPDSYEAGDGIEIIAVTHEDEFRVLNQEYFFDRHGLTCGLNARIWTTVNDGDILAAMCIHNNGGNQVPLFVGLTADSVKVSQNYDSTILGPNGSFDYLGKTWYFTADYALSGTDGQDTQGHIQTLPTTYTFNSTPSNFVPAAKDLIDLAVLLPDVTIPTINAKIGEGLQFDSNGAIEVNVGDGLDIDPITNELFVNGQLPEGTIIKKLTYVGDGSYTNSNIHFTKKPLAILSLYGYASPTNLNIFISASPAPIDSPYLHGIWGGQSGTTGYEGTACRAEMSYDDSTNVLTLYHPSDEGISFNISGQIYQLYYLTKGHAGSGTSETNMVSVVKTFSYVGTGTSTNNIQFPETPDMLLSIAGIGGDNTYIATTPTPMDATKLDFAISDGSNNNGVGGALMSFNDTTNVLTLSSSRSDSWVFNTSGVTYQVRYIVNEVISSSSGGTNYIPGEGIEFTELSSSLYADKVRMEITGIKSYSEQGPGAPYCQMRYFEFSDSNYTTHTVVSGTAIWSDGTTVEYPSASETIDVMIDDIGKMCVEHFNGTKSLVLTFDLDSPVSYDDLQYFRYKTGDDAPERDPISWKIYFNNTNSVNNWNLAGVVESVSITDNREAWTQYFPLTVNEFNTVVISATGGSGDTIAEGAGIEITTDQQTGNKVIAINPGTGLQVNQTTNELEVSGGVVTSISPTQNTPGSITVTEGDGTTSPVSVISRMGGATSSTAGTAGYVPAPAAGDNDAYLRGDGTWDDSVVTEDDELTLVFVPDDYQP